MNCLMWYSTDGWDRNIWTTAPSVLWYTVILDDVDVRDLAEADPRERPAHQVPGLNEAEPSPALEPLRGLDDDLDPRRVEERQASQIERDVPAMLDLRRHRFRER